MGLPDRSGVRGLAIRPVPIWRPILCAGESPPAPTAQPHRPSSFSVLLYTPGDCFLPNSITLIPLPCGFQLGLTNGRHWQMGHERRGWGTSSCSGPASAPWFYEGLLCPRTTLCPSLTDNSAVSSHCSPSLGQKQLPTGAGFWVLHCPLWVSSTSPTPPKEIHYTFSVKPGE